MEKFKNYEKVYVSSTQQHDYYKMLVDIKDTKIEHINNEIISIQRYTANENLVPK